jgi:hypothetical protein
MSRRKLAWIIIACAGMLSIAGLFWTMCATSRLVLSEVDIQTRLNRELPRTVREATVDRVAMHFADDHLTLRGEVHGTILHEPVAATVIATGIPRYDAQRGQMSFDADVVKIDQLTVAGRNVIGGPDTRGRLSEAVSAATRHSIESAIKLYLATEPVYRFKDDFKGVVLKASLVNVAIEQNSLVLTFSLWNLTTTVAGFALVLFVVLLIIYVLVRHPLWGLERAVDLATISG